MKSFKLSIIILILTSGQLFANSDSLCMRAIQLYEDEAYESALESYREIIESGYASPGLYYNMGNAAFRSNSIGLAVLYYEKTLKMDPTHRDAAHNLEYISRYKVDAFEEVPVLFLRTWINTAVHALPERTWSIMALSGFMLTLVFLLLYIFTHGLALKKTGFFLTMIGVLFTIFTLSSALTTHHAIVQPDTGIILAPSVVVKSTPSETGTELFILHEGSKVRVNEEVSGWHNIRIIDGREGWIRTDDFGTI